jgi:hypothetical protein
VCVCEWRGEFNRVVLVVQLGLIFHFILNPEQRRVFQLVNNNTKLLQEGISWSIKPLWHNTYGFYSYIIIFAFM